jgi:hypothetical protein
MEPLMKMIHDSLERVMKATANSDRVSLNHKELHHKYICRLTCAEVPTCRSRKLRKLKKLASVTGRHSSLRLDIQTGTQEKLKKYFNSSWKLSLIKRNRDL